MLVAKFNFFHVITLAIKQKMPNDADGNEVKPKWIDRVHSRMGGNAQAEAEAKVAGLKAANPEADYLIEEESGRMVERMLSGVREAYQMQSPKNVKAMPEGVDPPTPPPVGVSLAFPRPVDWPEDAPDPQEFLRARGPDERHHPRWVEIINEAGKQIARYEL